MSRWSGEGHRFTPAAVAAGVIVVAVSLAASRPGPSGVGRGEGGPPPAAHAAPVRAAPQPPVAVRLPDGARLRVRAVATRQDGRLAVPDDVRVAGWWVGGARVGDPLGSTLVAAHVDSSSQGLGPAAGLLSARVGQQVALRSVRLAQVFRVVSTRVIPRSSFAHRPRLVAPGGPRRLVLVTCAPPYDASTGYRNLAVVVARPVGLPREVATTVDAREAGVPLGLTGPDRLPDRGGGEGSDEPDGGVR